jgi:hypothetical protein
LSETGLRLGRIILFDALMGAETKIMPMSVEELYALAGDLEVFPHETMVLFGGLRG